jgi:hypothetical protein
MSHSFVAPADQGVTFPRFPWIDLYHAQDDILRMSFDYRSGASRFNQSTALRYFANRRYVKIQRFECDFFAVCGIFSEAHPYLKMLEKAYLHCQNFDGSWRPENPVRSTSVGDIMVVEGGSGWIIAPVGFDRLF